MPLTVPAIHSVRYTDTYFAFRRYGYILIAHPIEGQEELFFKCLREGLDKIEKTLETARKLHGYRGYSKRALAALHSYLPHPADGVELRD